MTLRAALLVAVKFAAIAVVCLVFMNRDVRAVNCRWFARDAKIAIGPSVATLQRLEHEASDRLKGLDTRPFAVLRDEAKKLAAIVAEPHALAREDELKGCRNWTQPIRKICTDAAQMLVDILDKHAANPKVDFDKPKYAAAIGECEKLLDLKPLTSAIRGMD